MTTQIEPASWPRVEATLTVDGAATVTIAGVAHPVTASTIDEARPLVVGLIARQAAQLGRPIRALMSDPTGQWPLIIAPDGGVEADPQTAPQERLAVPTSPATPPSAANEPAPMPTPAAEAAAHTGAHRAPMPATEQRPQVPAPARPASTEATRVVEVAPRRSFLTEEVVEEPATTGWRGFLTRCGIRVTPSAEERAERADVAAVSQHWPGPRTIAIVNSKGGAGKTPTTVCLAAVFARYGGAGVLTWDNNQTRGTLGWRTEQGPHDATLLDLLPQTQRLLSPSSQAADLAHYVHHQTRDRFDVLRSKPTALAHEQRVEPDDVDAIHSVAAKYYRLVFIDSGNDESDPMWLRMIDHTDQLVVATTTRDDHAEAGALLLEALAARDARSAQLAAKAVVVVSQADSKAAPSDVARVADGYRTLARDVAQIPFDPAMVDGLLRLGSLRPTTQRAWLAAAAAVARGL